MNRLDKTFSSLDNNAACILFITAGDVKSDKKIEDTVEIMHSLVEGGADIIELGVPFSDPSADGKTIQQSTERALEKNVSLKDVFNICKLFRGTNNETPIVLMGYVNPIEKLGYEDFVNEANESGVDGLITVDLPPEESKGFDDLLDKNDIYPIYLLAPTSSSEREDYILSKAKGFVYYVAFKGVTGSKEADYSQVEKSVENLKNKTKLPIGVGFGIKDNNSFKKVSEFADAVVVGSVLVSYLHESDDEIVAAKGFVEKLKN